MRPLAFDRRRFLVSSTGTLFALPFLEALAPREARAQATSPKRLLVMTTPGGRVVGRGHVVNGVRQDWWIPRSGSTLLTATGALPPGLSPMLAPLEPVRNQIVTIDGVDNVLRHAATGPAGNEDCGHAPQEYTALTCRVPAGMRATGAAGGPSIDYVAGQRLRANAGMRESIIFLSTVWTINGGGQGNRYFGAAGGSPTLAHNANPATAIANVFSGFQGGPHPPTPTLRDKLTTRRASLLDPVLGSFTSLRRTLDSSDRARLDEHADRVRALEQRLSAITPPIDPMGDCRKPDERAVPTYGISNYDLITSHPEYARGALDATIAPIWIELLVQAFACDLVRSAGFAFPYGADPVFPSEPLAQPLQAGEWHSFVHGTTELTSPNAVALRAGFQFWAKMFTLLVQRLAQVRGANGQPLLDDTLVLWVSEHGYGADHNNYNLPVVMAGLKGQFPNGQGRHVVQSQRRTTGDLYAKVLRMLGGTDATFGETGTLGDVVSRLGGNPSSHNYRRDQDSPLQISAATPLHTGGFDL